MFYVYYYINSDSAGYFKGFSSELATKGNILHITVTAVIINTIITECLAIIIE